MRSFTLALALASFLLPAWALAQGGTEADRIEARSLLEEGGRLYEAGDYAGALAKFEGAYRLFPSPKLYFNMGQAYRGLARDVEALEAFEAFLAKAKGVPAATRSEASQAVTQLMARVGQLSIVCEVAGANISVDGRDAGVTPRETPVRVTPGTHQVVVEKIGHRRFFDRVQVAAGASQTVQVALPADSDTVAGHGGSRSADDGIAQPPAEIGAADGPVRTRAPDGLVAGSVPRPSRARRMGAFLRLDLAVLPESGQRLVPGLSFGLTETIELAAAAVVGRDNTGFWLGGKAYFLDGAVKPSLSLGLPVIFLRGGGGTAVGVQGSAGISVDLGRHLAFFADLGAAFFPAVDTELGRLWFLPLGGVHVRL